MNSLYGEKHKKNSGFTLIELVLTIAILMIVVVGFSYLFVNGFKTISMSGRRSSTNFLLQKAAEQMISNNSINAEITEITNETIDPIYPITVELNQIDYNGTTYGDYNTTGNSTVLKTVENVDGRILFIDIFYK